MNKTVLKVEWQLRLTTSFLSPGFTCEFVMAKLSADNSQFGPKSVFTKDGIENSVMKPAFWSVSSLMVFPCGSDWDAPRSPACAVTNQAFFVALWAAGICISSSNDLQHSQLTTPSLTFLLSLLPGALTTLTILLRYLERNGLPVSMSSCRC